VERQSSPDTINILAIWYFLCCWCYNYESSSRRSHPDSPLKYEVSNPYCPWLTGTYRR